MRTRTLHLVGILLPFIFPAVQGSEDVRGKSYDYVIVGGGTSGLIVANRLSEDKRSEYFTNTITPILHTPQCKEENISLAIRLQLTNM